ncbi:fimbria/pilus outer membrane usher protein, partial [Bacillus thuringiensis]|nr:fimbria/pilus outer membrane usher protein [Bacillus thuringiensis]
NIQFHNIQLISNNKILPNNQHNFTPTIHNITHNNTKITISQHKYIIYKTFISPKTFTINHLYPT